MNPRGWIVCAGLLGALAVAAGAFGAHALRDHWKEEPRRLEVFEVAARYQMYHALALLAVALLAAQQSTPVLQTAGWSFLVGTIIFSGMLYLLAFTQVAILGAIVPIGGVLFIVGWLCLAVAGWQRL